MCFFKEESPFVLFMSNRELLNHFFKLLFELYVLTEFQVMLQYMCALYRVQITVTAPTFLKHI